MEGFPPHHAFHCADSLEDSAAVSLSTLTLHTRQQLLLKGIFLNLFSEKRYSSEQEISLL